MHEDGQETAGTRPAERGVRLREVSARDLAEVLVLNEAAVPAVNSVPREFFAGWLEALDDAGPLQPFFQVAECAARESLLGFVLALPPGCTYGSINYRWFSDRHAHFLYVDRIVVDGEQRGLGIGRRLYDAVAAEARRRGLERVCCEVNLKPRNEGSLRFHARYGFREVGRQPTEAGRKEVSLQVLECGRP